MRSREFIAETTVLDHIDVEFNDHGFLVTILVNETFSSETSEFRVSEMSLFISIDPGGSSGDLGIHYDVDGENEDEYPYGDRAFISQVRQYLKSIGVPAYDANDVDFSESGMQDEGRASCDAYGLVEYLRAAILNSIDDPAQQIAVIKRFPGLLLHIEHISPQVADACKTDIIRYCLGQFKTGQTNDAMTVVSMLKASGINWPEFAAMEKSAAAISAK